MALSATQTVYFEQRLGTLSSADVVDIEARLLRLGGDGYEPQATVEILQTRLANMLKNPVQFSVPGDYSENRSKNVEELRKQLDTAETEAGVAGTVLTSVPPQPYRWNR